MDRDVFFVLVVLGDTHRQGALDALRGVVRRSFPQARVRGVVVDNSWSGQVERVLDDSTTCISGDNRWREFSAWDRGLAWLDRAFSISPEAAIVLANDTLHRSYGSRYLQGFRP